jgi:hypothetical protein
LAQFLYKINFLTARKDLQTGEIVRMYFEQNRYLSSELVDFGFDWEVHPAYRWALQPQDIRAIFYSLALSDDGASASAVVAEGEEKSTPPTLEARGGTV